jgi:hypothetical protein
MQAQYRIMQAILINSASFRLYLHLLSITTDTTLIRNTLPGSPAHPGSLSHIADSSRSLKTDDQGLYTRVVDRLPVCYYCLIVLIVGVGRGWRIEEMGGKR